MLCEGAGTLWLEWADNRCTGMSVLTLKHAGAAVISPCETFGLKLLGRVHASFWVGT